jgi:hypothetical protein
MSGWELFTWITVFILGAIVVFVLFIKDITQILKKFQKEKK